MSHEPFPPEVEAIGRTAVDAGLKVHSVLGPGLLESVYEHCLAHELELRGIVADRQAGLPIVYEGWKLDFA